MSDPLEWLPSLVRLNDYAGDWEQYYTALFSIFTGDFHKNPPACSGLPVRVNRQVHTNGREAGFWHVISEGSDEQSRRVDPKRCERLAWIKPIIEHINDGHIKVWKNKRGNKTRVLLWLEHEDYLVVLEEHKTHYFLVTAFYAAQEHTRRKWRKEYEAYQKANAAP